MNAEKSPITAIAKVDQPDAGKTDAHPSSLSANEGIGAELLIRPLNTRSP